MAEELGRPRGPLLHPDDIGPGFGGLGGFADQEDQPHFIDLPRLDPRMNPNDPNMVRGIVVLPRRGPEARATEIKCPECRKPTLVPADGLPVNYRVQEIVQKVAPLFKDRHLVKLCNQCEAVLSQGVYFDCSQCEETGRKICSTCAIRLHNGHQLVEKKALTSDDVREMKQKISDASHAAFQSLENLKPRLQSVGGTIEAKALDVSFRVHRKKKKKISEAHLAHQNLRVHAQHIRFEDQGEFDNGRADGGSEKGGKNFKSLLGSWWTC